MVRLTSLRIDRFRNVKPGTVLHFGPTFNVLLGKNATGKSTLLDLVAAVTNDDLSAYADEDVGFDLTWSVEEGEQQIEQRAVRTPATTGTLPEGVRQEKEFDDRWTISIRSGGIETDRLEVTGTRGLWKPMGEREQAFDVRAGLGTPRAGLRTLFAVSDTHAGDAPITGAVSRIRAVFGIFPWRGSIGRFDEALASMELITQSSFVLSRERGGGGSGALGSWLPRQFMHAADELASTDPLVVPFERLGALASSSPAPGPKSGSLTQIPAILGFTSAEIHPRVMRRSQDGQSILTNYQGFDCLFRRADGSQISHQLLSFGQKRLLSFLWYLAVRDNLPVVADELLNGLHHEWIEICFERLRERQSFLATQHPLLLDHIPIASAEAVRTTFVRCSVEIDPDGRQHLAWRNFDEEEAERFFTAYQTGIQQVSEVLRTEGLW